jgi:hypothetical protein
MYIIKFLPQRGLILYFLPQRGLILKPGASSPRLMKKRMGSVGAKFTMSDS